MSIIRVPNSASLHTAKAFLSLNDFFAVSGMRAVLRLDPRWMHIEPFALAMLAAWGHWCRRHGIEIQVENLGPKGDYAWRMHLFEHLGVDYAPARVEREEAGRFLPVTQVRRGAEIQKVIADIQRCFTLKSIPKALPRFNTA